MTEIQEVPAETPPPAPPEERKPRWFPTAFTVLAAVLLLVWGLSFVIPSGAYEVDAETGGPKPGTYQEIDTDKSIPHQFYKLWNAPTNGLYGIENDAGNVSVDNTGVLYGAAQIFLFVLAIGAFISVTMKTGAIQAGIGLRVVLWFVIVAAAIAYVLRYAYRVRRDSSHSVLGAEGMTSAGLKLADEAAGDVEPLTARQRFVLVLFAFAFVVLIYGFVPWGDIWDSVFSADFPLPTFTSFYFAQATVLFLVMAVVIGLVAKLGEEGTVTAIISGASDFLGAALIIVVARSVTVVMKNSDITDTILHWTEDAVTGTSSSVFAGLLLLVNLPIAFLVPSSSGHAALVMPILAPLADFAQVPRSIAVTGYQSASGLVNLITPTSAVVMGGIALARIRYDQFLRFVLPFFAIALVISVAFVVVGAALS